MAANTTGGIFKQVGGGSVAPIQAATPVTTPSDFFKNSQVVFDTLKKEIAQATGLGSHLFEFFHQGAPVTVLLVIDDQNQKKFSVYHSGGLGVNNIPGLTALLRSFTKNDIDDVSGARSRKNIENHPHLKFFDALCKEPSREERENILCKTAGVPRPNLKVSEMPRLR